MPIFPDDPRYPTLVRGFNLRWVGNPEYVEVCASPADVVAAVQSAIDQGLRITFRGGGHCYENFVSGNDGGVILDLSAMNGVSRDDAGVVCVEGGATLWNVYSQLEREFGLVLPAGSCYSVGAGGHITAGGYGLLARLHGLTVDHLTGVEMIVVDATGTAQVITAMAGSGDPAAEQLLWACQGGGGGNFGVITKFFFADLPPAPAWATIMTVAWNWSALTPASFAAIVEAYGAFCVEHAAPGDEFEAMFTLLHLNASTSPQISLTAQTVDPGDGSLEALLEAMTDAVPPAAAPTFQTLPWLFATQTLDGSGPNRRGKYKSAYMVGTFPPEQIDAMWDALTNAPAGAQSLLQVDSYGGQVNAVASDATAVAQRSSAMKLQFQTYWYDEAADAPNLAWMSSFYDAMYGPDGPVPDGTMDGCYVGYPDVDLVDWPSLYYQGNYSGLQAVKAKWDPLNVFNHAQSIALP